MSTTKKSNVEIKEIISNQKSQNTSKYDSHPEKKPHQSEIVSTDSEQDRVSHSNRNVIQSEIDTNVKFNEGDEDAEQLATDEDHENVHVNNQVDEQKKSYKSESE